MSDDVYDTIYSGGGVVCVCLCVLWSFVRLFKVQYSLSGVWTTCIYSHLLLVTCLLLLFQTRNEAFLSDSHNEFMIHRVDAHVFD